MTFPVVCCYTYPTRTHFPWGDAEHCANKFKNAIKGEAVNGTAHLPIPGTNPREYWTLAQANAGEAPTFFGRLAPAALRTHGIPADVDLVPMPCSACTVDDAVVPRTVALAEVLAIRSRERARVVDCVRFARPMASAHSAGGTRDAQEILDGLAWRRKSTAPSRPVLMVDDVLTSGGHLRALAAFLESHGFPVVGAVCAVRAMSEPVAAPLTSCLVHLERLDVPPVDIPF